MYPGGSSFLLHTGTEMPNKVTPLEVFGRKVHKCTHLLMSYEAEELKKGSKKRDVWVSGMERPNKVRMATSLTPGCRLLRADVHVMPCTRTWGVNRGGLQPSQALPAVRVQAVFTRRSTVFSFAKGTIKAQNLFPFVSQQCSHIKAEHLVSYCNIIW